MTVMIDLPNDSPLERKRMGRALAHLREDAGKTQPQAAEAAGLSSVQAWQNYEYAKRRFTPDLVRTVCAALKRPVEDLLEYRARIVAGEGAEPVKAPTRRSPFELPLLGRVRAGPQGLSVYDGGEAESMDLARYFGPDVRVLRLADEGMIPYAEPGGFVTYHLNELPQRNKGCVILMNDGAFLVKRYDFIRGGVLTVTELHPEERQLQINLTDVQGVYPIGLRGD